MKKKIFTLLTLLVCLCSTGAWADTVTFGRTVEFSNTPTDYTIVNGDSENSNVTISDGGQVKANKAYKMYNNGSNVTMNAALTYHRTKYGDDAVEAYNENVYTGFKLVLPSGKNLTSSSVDLKVAVQDGTTCRIVIVDKDNTVLYTSSDKVCSTSSANTFEITPSPSLTLSGTVYVRMHYWFTGSGTAASKYVVPLTLTVKGTYEEVVVTKAATPEYTSTWNSETSKYDVTLTCSTDASTIYYSTDNKANYSEYSETLALDPGTTLDAYATADGLDQSDDMATYTAPYRYNITYAIGDGSGVVPAAATSIVNGTVITLPKNYSMYLDGYTLTKWVDESKNEYEPGSEYTVSADQTLTAKYTSNNGVTLANRTTATTIKWVLGQSAGVPDFTINSGETGFVVAQATVAGSTIDVKLPIDCSEGGKYHPGTNQWGQVNNGTEFTIPSANGATITYNDYDNNVLPSTTTVQQINVTEDGDTYTHTVSVDNHFYEYIQVVLPVPSFAITYDNEIENGSISGDVSATVGSIVNVTTTPDDGYEFGALVITKTSDGTDVTASCSVSDNTFTMPAYAVTVSATFVETPIVTLPDATRNGYNCTGTTEVVDYSGHVYNDETVYLIAAGGSMNITVPGTTYVSKIRVSGTSNDNKTSTVTIIGANEESVNLEFNNRKSVTASVLDFTPTTRTTTFTISSATKGSWVKIAVYGTEGVVSSFGWASYISPDNVSFEENTAYVVTAVNKSTGAVSVEAVTSVPANTPLILKGAGTKTITTLGEAPDAPATNLLEVYDGTTDKGTQVPYVLAKNGEEAGFKKWTGENSALAKRVVLWLDSEVSSARGFFFFSDDETTGIKQVESKKVQNSEFYNIAGQRVAQPTKGLYIVNGKKVVIK